MRRIVWSDEAISDLMGIADYIDQFNPLAAERLSERLIKAASSLGDFSDRGRPLANGFRELAVISPYLIRYRVEGDRVQIYSLWHGARAPE